MTKREAILSALEHREIRPVPWTADLTSPERERLCAYYHTDAPEAVIDGYIYTASVVSADMEDIGNERFRDYFGVVWNRSGPDKDIGVVEGAMIPEPEEEYIVMPPVPVEEIREKLTGFRERGGDRFCLVNFGFSLFERYWTLRGGLEHALMDFAAEPEFCEKLFGAICEFNLRCVDEILKYPLDGILFGDDWGQQKGLIMGPGHWRHYIYPCLEKMYGRVRNAGKYVFQHSCGDISEVYPDLIRIGLNVHQTFQPEIYDVEKMKALYGGSLTFWGGVSTQRLLPFASPEEVSDTTRWLLDTLGRGGGYIAAPTHSVPYDVPPENFDAMLKAFQSQ